MQRWLKSAFAVLALALAAPGVARAAPEVRVADNVYVVPDPKAKVVTLWMIVYAGCRDEENGQCRGLAHYLEHLMFLGRNAEHDTSGARVFSAGQTNAYSTMMTTAYYQTAPAREGRVVEDLEKLFALYADRMRGLDVAPDAAARERNVVLQEYNFRRVDSFRSRVYQDINRRLQPEHPVSQAVIGTREDIGAFSLEKVKAFHDRWYAKNNATFVVYGPVTADDVKTLAQKYVEPLPRKRVPSRSWLDARRSFEPLDETKRLADPEVKRPEIVFEKIVRYEDDDPNTTAAANGVLFDYLNSQLRGSLNDVFNEERELVTQIRASTSPLGAGVVWLTVSATMEEGVAPETMRAELDAYFTALAKSGVPEGVVERLKKRRATASAELQKDPQQTLSALTNWFAAHRNYADWQARDETLAAVKPATMQRTLDALAGPGRRVFGILTPPEGTR